MEKKYTGWIIVDHGIPIYQTLFTTRAECIRRFCISGGSGYMNRKVWTRLVQQKKMACRKVLFAFADKEG